MLQRDGGQRSIETDTSRDDVQGPEGSADNGQGPLAQQLAHHLVYKATVRLPAKLLHGLAHDGPHLRH